MRALTLDPWPVLGLDHPPVGHRLEQGLHRRGGECPVGQAVERVTQRRMCQQDVLVVGRLPPQCALGGRLEGDDDVLGARVAEDRVVERPREVVGIDVGSLREATDRVRDAGGARGRDEHEFQQEATAARAVEQVRRGDHPANLALPPGPH